MNDELSSAGKPCPEDEQDMEVWIEYDIGDKNIEKLADAFV